jgi:hypothetical protein
VQVWPAGSLVHKVILNLGHPTALTDGLFLCLHCCVGAQVTSATGC